MSAIWKYNVYFSNAGVPATGLKPVPLLFNQDTGIYTSGVITEIGRGWYKLYVSGTAVGVSRHTGYVDGESTALTSADRFLPIQLDPYDFAIETLSDANLTTATITSAVNAQLTAAHGPNNWVTSGIETSIGTVQSTINTVNLNVVSLPDVMTAQHGTGTWVTSGIETSLASITTVTTLLQVLLQNRLEFDIANSTVYKHNDAGVRAYYSVLTDSAGAAVTTSTTGPINMGRWTAV